MTDNYDPANPAGNPANIPLNNSAGNPTTYLISDLTKMFGQRNGASEGIEFQIQKETGPMR